MKNNSKLLAVSISVITFVLGIIVTMFLRDSNAPSSIYPWAENIILITSFII